MAAITSNTGNEIERIGAEGYQVRTSISLPPFPSLLTGVDNNLALCLFTTSVSSLSALRPPQDLSQMVCRRLPCAVRLAASSRLVS